MYGLVSRSPQSVALTRTMLGRRVGLVGTDGLGARTPDDGVVTGVGIRSRYIGRVSDSASSSVSVIVSIRESTRGARGGGGIGVRRAVPAGTTPEVRCEAGGAELRCAAGEIELRGAGAGATELRGAGAGVTELRCGAGATELRGAGTTELRVGAGAIDGRDTRGASGTTGGSHGMVSSSSLAFAFAGVGVESGRSWTPLCPRAGVASKRTTGAERIRAIRPFGSVRAKSICAPGFGIADIPPGAVRSSVATYCAPTHFSADVGIRVGRAPPFAATCELAASTDRHIPPASSRRVHVSVCAV